MPENITTRDGRNATIYCTDAPGFYPIHGRVEGYEPPCRWTSKGSFCHDGVNHPCDLMLEPKKRTLWLAIWLGDDVPTVGARYSEEEAKRTFSSADAYQQIEIEV